jgi:hypothetical protein
MISVNLLSSDALYTRRRARRVRYWTLIVVVVACLSAVPISLGVVKTAQAAALARQIGPLQMKFEDTRSEVADLVAQCEELTIQTSRADALRAKRDWASLLIAITSHTRAEVWLAEVETLAQNSGNPSLAGKSVVMLDGPMGVRLTGYALDHEWLYEFMGALKSTELFAQVKLTQAGKEPVLSGEAVRFVLECVW